MKGYTYKGYTYLPWNDFDDDCAGIWHDFEGPEGTIDCDFTPYETMTPQDIRLWIDLGLPGRIPTTPMSTPLNSHDLLWLSQNPSRRT
jgi:hypothetical protein